MFQDPMLYTVTVSPHKLSQSSSGWWCSQVFSFLMIPTVWGTPARSLVEYLWLEYLLASRLQGTMDTTRHLTSITDVNDYAHCGCQLDGTVQVALVNPHWEVTPCSTWFICGSHWGPSSEENRLFVKFQLWKFLHEFPWTEGAPLQLRSSPRWQSQRCIGLLSLLVLVTWLGLAGAGFSS